ncbi:hypothetical protein I3760_01G292200 [Carya illinoinensis]|nr:hypothetical protein I3760_01G292200 [Carya illinoinensis]
MAPPPLSSSTFILSLYLFSLLLITTNSIPTTLGVTYFTPVPSTTQPKPAPPVHIATAISSLGFNSIRVLNPDPTLTRAFTYTNTTLFLTIPNPLVKPIASNRSMALRWLYVHVVPFYPRARITTISVGNDFLSASPSGFYSFLLPAIRNVHLALRNLGIRKISVSTSFSFVNIISTPFPPSSAEFQGLASDNLIKPLLQFLRDTNSSFLINIYPYKVYRLNCEIPIGFALFQEHPFNFRDDLITGVRYRNLFDMMVDAAISAMTAVGFENIPVVVAETGWPSSGDALEVDANSAYAEMYLRGLVAHLKSGLGTPLRKEGVAEAYIYELFDDEVRRGTTRHERSWGILFSNMTKKYEIEFSGSDSTRGSRAFLYICSVAVAVNLIHGPLHLLSW